MDSKLRNLDTIDIASATLSLINSLICLFLFAYSFDDNSGTDRWNWSSIYIRMTLISVPFCCWGAFALAIKHKANKHAQWGLIIPVYYLIMLGVLTYFPHILDNAQNQSEWTVYPPIRVK